MKKLIGIVGMPGTGKTTLMRHWMSTRTWTKDTPIKLLDTMVSNNIRLFGKYEDGDTFAGTDKLSMAVQPVVIEYLKNPTHDVNIFEGDRLTSVALFNEAIRMGYDVSIVVLTVDDTERERRYAERGSNQPDSWVQGRRTKIKNIVENFSGSPLTDDPSLVTEFVHSNAEDTKTIANHIENLVK